MQRTIKISFNQFFVGITLFVIFIFAYLFDIQVLLIVPILFLSLLLFLKYRESLLGLPCFLMLWSNYSIIAYFWLNLYGQSGSYSYKYFYMFPETLRMSLIVIYCFVSVLFLLVYFANTNQGQSKIVFAASDNQANTFVSFSLSIFLLLVLFYFIYERMISGIYEESTIFEYMSIIFILAYFYSGEKGSIRILLTMITVLYCIFVFENGDRGSAIQFLLIFFYFSLYKRIGSLNFILIFIVGVIFLSIIGDWRNNYDLSLYSATASIVNFIKRGITLDTAFASEACGMAIVQMHTSYAFFERLTLLLLYLASVVAGGTFVGEKSNLASMARDFCPYHGGGGMLFNYGYFYLGFFGVVLLAVILSLYFKKILSVSSESNGLTKCVALYLICTSTRWYIYSPAPLFRGALILVILYLFISTFLKKAN